MHEPVLQEKVSDHIADFLAAADPVASGSAENTTRRDVQLRLSRIALIHALCQVPAMLALAQLAAELVAAEWGRSHRIVGLVAWSFQPLPPKIQSIVEYGLLLAIAAALVLAITAYVRGSGKTVAFSAWQWTAFAIYEGACLLPFLVLTASAFAAAVWFYLAMALPAWLASRYLGLSVRADRLLLAACVAGIGFVLWLLFSGSWSPGQRFLNDYPDLREYTRMDSGRLVENREFMRNKRTGGRSVLDPCSAKSEPDSPAPGSCLRLPRSVFSDARESFLLFPPGHGQVYDWDQETLSARVRLSTGEAALIGAIWGLRPDEPALAQFVATAENIAAAAEWPQTKTAEEAEFFGKNRIVFDAQIHPGAFFSRHARLYLPALAMAELPDPKSTTPAQHGDGLTRALGWLLRQAGAPNFQSYYAIYWLALAAYLALLGTAAQVITRDPWAGVAAVALGTGALLAVSHDTLRAAPDLNPLRHLPDLLCLVAVAIEARRRTYGSALLRAGAIGLLLWWNRDFGLCFLGGSIAWLLIEVVAGDRSWRGGARQVGLEVAVASAVLIGGGIGSVGDLARHDPTGIGGSAAGLEYVFAWAFLWTMLIGWLVWARFERLRTKDDAGCGFLVDIAGVGALYAALASVYAVWNLSRNYLALVLLLAVVPFVAMVVWAGRSSTGGRAHFGWLTRYAAVVSVLIAVVFAFADREKHHEFERAFEEHQQFSWNFPGFSGVSTAEPSIMRDSVTLIDKHQPQGRVLLVSRYESLLRTLTNRAGVLPYADLAVALTDWETVDRLAERILRSGAPVLFVDRDIFAVREGEIPLFGGKPDSGARNRVGALAVLGQMFRLIARCYAPGESGGALQVWHRSCEADSQ